MAFGYGLKAFAGGFQTGLGLGLERKKMEAIKEEQKRQEKLVKEKEENAMNWLSTNKDSLMNYQTQPQEKRNMLLYESVKYSDDWHKLLRDFEDALQEMDLEELKSLNDMAEEKIKAERDMLDLGIRPENAFIGEGYTEKDMNFVKQLNIGKLPDETIRRRMFGERFGELPEEVKTPTAANRKLDWATEHYNLPEGHPEKINFDTLLKFFGVDVTPEEAKGLEKRVQDIETEGKRAGIPQDQIDTAIRNEILGKPSTPLLVKVVDPNDVLFGTRGIMKDYIGSGSQLGEEQRTEIRNNYEIIKPSLDVKTQKQVEEYLGQIGIDVDALIPESELPPEPEPTLIERGIKGVQDWLGRKGETMESRRGLEIPTPKVPTVAKEAMIPTMSKEELHKAMSDTDRTDPLWDLLYAEAVKRGYITE